MIANSRPSPATLPGPESAAPRTARKISLALSLLGAGLMIGTGTHRYWVDGSLWIDEATVAHTILSYAPSEYFGRLIGEQTFPRLSLLVIAGLTELVGYSTLVLRSLPFGAYVIGTALWMRLLYVRFACMPAVLFVGVALTLVPTTWTVYGVMLKQYSLDAMLALGALAVSDTTLDSILQRGERRHRAALLFLPWLFSYTYVFAMAGRLAGYLLYRLAGEKRRLDVPSLAITGGACAAVGGLLYLTDVRYAPTQLLTRLWDHCLLVGRDGLALRVIDNLFAGWYRSSVLFRYTDLGDVLIWVLRCLAVVGCLAAWLGLRPRLRGAPASPGDWGSRILAVPMTVLILIVGSIPLGYPLCACRLTLFVLPSLQLLTLEGLALLVVALRRAPRGALLGTLAAGALGAALLPGATHSIRRLLETSPPGDLRPALEEIRRVPERPVVADPCTHEMTRALPDDWTGLVVSKSIYARKDPALDGKRNGDVWVLRGVERCWVMGEADELLHRATYNWRRVPLGSDDVVLRVGRLRRAPPPR